MYHFPLNARERDILELLADGQTNEAIALKLRCSVHAVKKIVGSIFGKLFVTNRTQAVAIAIQYGLINPQIKQAPYEEWLYQARNIERSDIVESVTPKVPHTLPPLPWADLTDREKEVMSFFRDGNTSNKYIEEKLVITHDTLRGHLRSIYQQLRVDREGLVELAKLMPFVESVQSAQESYRQTQFLELASITKFVHSVHQYQEDRSRSQKSREEAD
jgi:DNA-binding NarL/FixJ family response regulator